MSRSRFFVLIVLLLIVVVLGDLIGSFGESGQLPVAEATDWMPTYRMAMSNDISTLNQWDFYGRNNDIFTGYILSNMTHSLYDLSHGGQWVPILADGFPSAPIQQEGIWDTIVTLKQGVSWSDGAPFTADDVVFTYETCRDLDLGGNWGAICHPEQLIDVVSVDDFTVLFTFNQFPGLGLWQGSFSQAPIMAQHYWDPVVQAAWEQEDPEFWLYDYSPVDEPVLGPFSFGMYSPGSYLELAANPNYFFQGLMVVEFANGAYQEILPGVYTFNAYGPTEGEIENAYTVGPHVGSVRYEIYENQDAAFGALEEGEVEFVLNPWTVSSEIRSAMESNPDLATVTNGANGLSYLAFNLRKDPMGQDAFRQAVAILIDRQFPELGLEDETDVLWSVVPAGNTFWHNPNVPRIGANLTRQERIELTVDILSEAGFTWTIQPSWDGEVIPGSGLHYLGESVPELEILTPDWDPIRQAIAIEIEGWLDEAGIESDRMIVDYVTMLDRVFVPDVDFDMYILGWGLGTFPSHMCDYFHSENDSNTTGNYNSTGYNSPTIDELCDQLMVETDIDFARQQTFTMQEILAHELPYVTLYSRKVFEAYAWPRIEYPFTDILGGLAAMNGLPSLVQYTPATESCIPPPDGLISWWPGDDTPADVWDDNHGTLQNGATYDLGQVNSGFLFDPTGYETGDADFVHIVGAENLDDLQQLTVEGWVRLDGAEGPENRIERFFTLAPPGIEKASIRHDGGNRPGQLHFFMRIDGDFVSLRSEPGDDLVPGIYHHVAGTYDGQVMKLYLDGRLVGETFAPGTVAVGNGEARLSSPDEPVNGLLDEFSVYDQALYSNEIRAIYLAGSVGKCYFESSTANDSWTRATRMEFSEVGDSTFYASAEQSIDMTGQTRWYQFAVEPTSQVVVKLTDLPTNYDLTLYNDIQTTYDSMTGEVDTEDLVRMTAESAPYAYSPYAYSPYAYSPYAYSPYAYSPYAYSPYAYSPYAYSPYAYSPYAYSPYAYSPYAYSPYAYSPYAYSPYAYSPYAYSAEEAHLNAEMRSVIGFSAFEGTADEFIFANTWDSTGDFYIRVSGRNGASAPAQNFLAEVTEVTGACDIDAPEGELSRITPEAGGYRSIILTDLDRMDLSEPLLTNLRTRLDAFAALPEVGGVVVDLAQDELVQTYNYEADRDANLQCPFAKNLVVKTIKEVLDGYWELNPLEYVVLIGNDDVIPFYRHPDRAQLARESNYNPPVDFRTPSYASLALDYVLSQDVYGSGLNLSVGNTFLPIQHLAVGRLVETYDDILTMLDAYESTSGGVLVPSSALVTGYDFLEDAALAVRAELEAGIGVPATSLISPPRVFAHGS